MGRRKKDQEESKIPPVKLNLSAETKRGIAVVVFAALALIIVLSLAGIAGSLGGQMYRALTWLFGVMAYLVPLILVSIAISLYKQNLEEAEKKHSSFYLRIYLGAVLLTASVGGLIHIFYLPNTPAFDLASQGRGGGYLGAIMAQPLFSLLGFWAGSLILFALVIISILVIF